MHSRLRSLVIVLAVLLPGLVSADDINAEFDCFYGEIPSDGKLEFAWVIADATPLNAKVLSRSRSETFISGSSTVIEYLRHYSRCPLVQDECEPSERIAAGMMVPIWKRQGQYACITPNLPHGGESGWVHEDHLRPIERTEPAQSDWVGTFTNGGFSEVTISESLGGELSASGAVIASAGEGPGFGFYGVSQIDLSPFKPQGNSGILPPVRMLKAMSRKDGVTWNSEGSAPSACHLTLRLSSPFLVIKDAPGCTDEQGSGFEGIWVKEKGRSEKAHPDHAKTIELGR